MLVRASLHLRSVKEKLEKLEKNVNQFLQISVSASSCQFLPLVFAFAQLVSSRFYNCLFDLPRSCDGCWRGFGIEIRSSLEPPGTNHKAENLPRTANICKKLSPKLLAPNATANISQDLKIICQDPCWSTTQSTRLSDSLKPMCQAKHMPQDPKNEGAAVPQPLAAIHNSKIEYSVQLVLAATRAHLEHPTIWTDAYFPHHRLFILWF
jgi:hypothetical protein